MYCAEAQSDVMRSALLTREAHITDEVNITPEGHITFRASGTHRSKKPNARALGFFVAGIAGFEPAKMPESKSGALPLGDIPLTTVLYHYFYLLSRCFILILTSLF